MSKSAVKLNTHEGFVWNFARVTAMEAINEPSKRALDSLMLREDPPKFDLKGEVPLNLKRVSPAILATGDYSGFRPHIYISFGLSTARAAQVANKCLWALVRTMYLDSRFDKADLSEWIDEGLAFSLVFASARFIAERTENVLYRATAPDFTPNRPDMTLGIAELWSLGYEDFPGMR